MNIRYVGEWLNLYFPTSYVDWQWHLPLEQAYSISVGKVNVVGLTVAQVIAMLGPQVPVLHWVIAILAAILIGAIWVELQVFKAKYEVSEVVATIMLNYVALIYQNLLWQFLELILTRQLIIVKLHLFVDFRKITNGSA